MDVNFSSFNDHNGTIFKYYINKDDVHIEASGQCLTEVQDLKVEISLSCIIELSVGEVLSVVVNANAAKNITVDKFSFCIQRIAGVV